MSPKSFARRCLLGVCLGLTGCVNVPDPPQAAQTQPPRASLLDRVLRRSSLPAPESLHVEAPPADPQDPGKLSLAYARMMEQAGDLSQAQNHYARALDSQPENLDALVGLGRVHYLAGRYDAAEQTYRRALKQQPQHAAALYGLGQTAAARQQWDEAADLLNAAVLAEPSNNAMRYDLAVALVQAGNIDAALPHFIRTVGDAEAHYNVGLILQRAGHLPESEQQLRLALAKDPHLQQAQHWLQIVQQQQQLPATPPTGLTDSTAQQLPSGVFPASYEADGAAPVIQPAAVAPPIW